MDITLQAALISGGVLILSIILAGLFAYFQQRRDRFRWA